MGHMKKRKKENLQLLSFTLFKTHSITDITKSREMGSYSCFVILSAFEKNYLDLVTDKISPLNKMILYFLLFYSHNSFIAYLRIQTIL